MGKQFKTQQSLDGSAERNNFERPNRIRTREKPHKCQHCSFASRYNYLLKNHGRVHTGEKPFNCRHCSFKTAYKWLLKSHEINHKGDKPFRCRHCPFKTAQKSSLKGHEQWHTGEGTYKCPLCPFATVRKSQLETHGRKHTGEKPFKCGYCSFRSAYKSSLKTHEGTHTGYRPFKCQHCPFATIQSSPLKKHTRKHSGEGPFKCQDCNYSSMRSSHLKIHQKVHTRGNLSKLKQRAMLRSSLAPQKRLQSGRKSLKCKIPPKATTVPSEKYAKIIVLNSSKKHGNSVPYHLQDLLEGDEEPYLQETQLDWSGDLENNKSSCRGGFEIFICKECNYALFSEKELCMHYSFCHKLPVVNLNIERTDCTIQQ